MNDARALTVLGYPEALNVRKVLWLLDEMEKPFHLKPVGGDAEDKTTDDWFARLNPHCLVPVVQDNGHTIWESHAILRYLAASYGRPQFWSEQPGERALVDMWMDWSQTVLEFDLNLDFFWRFHEGPGDDPEAFKSAHDKSISLLDILENQLDGNQFICGGSLSLADIVIGILVHRYLSMPVERPAFPNITAWYKRLADRPAFQARICTA